MRVIFMGTPDYANTILHGLIADEKVEVVAVYTQPDKPVGRKKVLTPPPVKVTAIKNEIPLYQPIKLREDRVVEALRKISCDYIVVAAYGQILPKAILDHAPCINLHASILPQYRGASPIQQTLLNGDSKSGVTAMLMEEGLDTGDILTIDTVNVPENMMLEELFYELTETAKELTLKVLHNFNSYSPLQQNESEATLCKKISKADGEVSFDDASNIYNRYRAFTPWPGIFLSSGLKLKSLALESNEGEYAAGEILSIEKESIVIGCKKGSLRIFTLQPASKKEMSSTAYVNGKRLNIADTLF